VQQPERLRLDVAVIASVRNCVALTKEKNSPMKEPAGVTEPVSAASEHCRYQRLPQELVEQLVSIYRSMFPHSAVPDEFYEHVVRKLENQAVHDQELSGLLFNGVEALNRQTGRAWAGLPEEARLQALQRVEQTPFFQRLRSDLVLYFTVTQRSGPSSDTRGHPTIKAVISIVASTTSTGSKKRRFNFYAAKI
jgi:hypothetical protein